MGVNVTARRDATGYPWIAVTAVHENGDLVGLFRCRDCAELLLGQLADVLAQNPTPARRPH